MAYRGGIFFSNMLGPPSPIALDAATTAWVNAVIANGGTVSDGRKTIVDNLIVGLKADGLWTKLDRLWLFAGENEPSALTDLIANASATSVNSTTFTVDRGYTGDGATMYIDSNVNITSTAGIQISQDSAGLFAWSNTSAGINGDYLGFGANFTNGQSYIYPRQLGGPFYAAVNDSNATGFTFSAAVSDGSGLFSINRSGASSQEMYRNGSQLNTSTNASTTPTNETLKFLRGMGGYGTRQICCGGFGSSLDSTDYSNLYSRMRTYMTAVGVP